MTRNPRLLLPLLAFGQFIAALDYTIVYVALPRIGSSLQFSPHDSQWVVSAYAVAYGSLLLVGGRATDVLGRNASYRTALILFGGGSLLGALAPDSATLIVGRLLQGAGGALLTPATLSVLNSSFAQGPLRNRALAVWGAAGGFGLAAGSLLGGLLTEAFGWRSVLMVNVPLTGAAVVGSFVALTATHGSRTPTSLDLPGALAVTVSVGALVVSLSQGPGVGWASPEIIVSIGVFVAATVSLIVRERRAEQPLIPGRLLRHRPLALAMATAFLFMASFGSEYYFFTVYFQEVLHYSVLQAGLAFLPASVLAVAGTSMAKQVLTHMGAAPSIVIGCTSGVVGMVTIALAMGVGRPYWTLLPGIAFLSIGQGIGWTAVFAAASTDVVAEEQGVAAALASTTQQVGLAVGLAVVVAIANATLHQAATTASVVAGLRQASAAAGAVAFGAALLGTIAWLRSSPPATLEHAGPRAR